MPDLADTVGEFWEWFCERIQAANAGVPGSRSSLDDLIGDEALVREACHRASFAEQPRVLSKIVAKYRALRNLDGVTETDAVASLADDLAAARRYDEPTREKLDALWSILRKAAEERGINVDRQGLVRAMYRVVAHYYAAVG